MFSRAVPRPLVAAAASSVRSRTLAAGPLSSEHSGNRFLAKLHAGETIVCAEGYLFEMERRGYVQIGPFVPEVSLTHPEAVRQLHREFVRAGSDVVEAFTYYANRAKLRLIGKEDILEPLNRAALRIAREVAEESGTLFAGNVSGTTSYSPDPGTWPQVREQFREQIAWAKEEGAEFVIAETFDHYGEAEIALEEINRSGLPAVVTFALANWTDGSRKGDKLLLQDGVPLVDACKRLHAGGAAVVGLNCHRGPETIIPPMRALRQECSFPLAALPVGYRCTSARPTMQELSAKGMAYSDLDCHTSTRYDWDAFTRECVSLGVQYVGTCCGAGPSHVRAIAMALGRHPEAANCAPAPEKHFVFGDRNVLSRVGNEVGSFTHKAGDDCGTTI
mmetsp:Transcript_48648/g.139010  ORF Transcript_48648/g.139010 Transcript_48648/m.139010 type:complete len:390 (-) Transcript_48648:42-1211(-)